MRRPGLIRSLGILFLCGFAQISASQQDIFAKSADLMKKLGLESEWRPSEMKREDSGTWHSLVSPRLQIRFFGSRLQFLSMKRIKPAGYTRSGGKMLDEKEVRGIAMKRFSQIRPGKNWFISQCTIGNKWSPPSVQIGYRIYGLTDSARTAWMNIDSADGKVLSLSVMDTEGLRYVTPKNLISASRAEELARQHAVNYLRRSKPKYAESLIKNMSKPTAVRTHLGYGVPNRELGSKIADYPDFQKVRFPTYFVDFGIIYVLINAKTGDCVGGGFPADSNFRG